MTDDHDTADPRDAYDVGDTTVRSKASAQVPSPPSPTVADRDEWEPDRITGYIHGVGGQYHVHFPKRAPWIPGGHKDGHELVALAVNESLHGPTSFTGLYVSSANPNYLLQRFISDDHKTSGVTTDAGVGTFLRDNDAVWVDDGAVDGVDVPVDDDGDPL